MESEKEWGSVGMEKEATADLGKEGAATDSIMEWQQSWAGVDSGFRYGLAADLDMGASAESGMGFSSPSSPTSSPAKQPPLPIYADFIRAQDMWGADGRSTEFLVMRREWIGGIFSVVDNGTWKGLTTAEM